MIMERGILCVRAWILRTRITFTNYNIEIVVLFRVPVTIIDNNIAVGHVMKSSMLIGGNNWKILEI